MHLDGVEVPAENLVGAENGSFKQVMRQMEHERGGIDRLVSNRRLYLDVIGAVHHDDPLARQEVAALESGPPDRASHGPARGAGQAPPGYSAVTKTFCTEFEQRVADLCARVAGADAPPVGTASPATSAMRPPTRSWAEPRRSCATSSASGSWGSPVNPDRSGQPRLVDR